LDKNLAQQRASALHISFALPDHRRPPCVGFSLLKITAQPFIKPACPASRVRLRPRFCAWAHWFGLERPIAQFEIGFEPFGALRLEETFAVLIMRRMDERAQRTFKEQR
jgi:hypothetical protein